jgi:hypothetical protein
MIVFFSEFWSRDYLLPEAPGESRAFADISNPDDASDVLIIWIG